jgi:hypothetical protein
MRQTVVEYRGPVQNARRYVNLSPAHVKAWPLSGGKAATGVALKTGSLSLYTRRSDSPGMPVGLAESRFLVGSSSNIGGLRDGSQTLSPPD